MFFNREKYRSYLKELNMSEADENDMLDFLYRLMDQAISAAFARDATSLALRDNEAQFITSKEDSMLDSSGELAEMMNQQIASRDSDQVNR